MYKSGTKYMNIRKMVGYINVTHLTWLTSLNNNGFSSSSTASPAAADAATNAEKHNSNGNHNGHPPVWYNKTLTTQTLSHIYTRPALSYPCMTFNSYAINYHALYCKLNVKQKLYKIVTVISDLSFNYKTRNVWET